MKAIRFFIVLAILAGTIIGCSVLIIAHSKDTVVNDNNKTDKDSHEKKLKSEIEISNQKKETNTKDSEVGEIKAENKTNKTKTKTIK